MITCSALSHFKGVGSLTIIRSRDRQVFKNSTVAFLRAIRTSMGDSPAHAQCGTSDGACSANFSASLLNYHLLDAERAGEGGVSS